MDLVFQTIEPHLTDDELLVKAVKLEQELTEKNMYSLYIWVFADERYSPIFKKRFFNLLYHDVDPWDLMMDIINLRDDEKATNILIELDRIVEIKEDLWISYLDVLAGNQNENRSENEEWDGEDDYPLPLLIQYVEGRVNGGRIADEPSWMVDSKGKIEPQPRFLSTTVEDGFAPVPGIEDDFAQSVYSITQKSDDEENIRILGPVNQCRGDLHDQTHDCGKYGGCRMFLCNEFTYQGYEDVYDEGESEVKGWYTGNCEQCNKQIPNKKCAVRQPRLYGGWLGCYCSIECISVRQGLSMENESELTFQLIYILREILTKHGIYR
jgi:hypothetical protein